MCMIGDFVKMRRVPKSKPIRAFRAWRQEGDHLMSWAFSDRWSRTGRLDAAYPPTAETEGGVWAFRLASEARDMGVCNDCVAGPVFLWGVVAEHEGGYRAQHAKAGKLWRTK